MVEGVALGVGVDLGHISAGLASDQRLAQRRGDEALRFRDFGPEQLGQPPAREGEGARGPGATRVEGLRRHPADPLAGRLDRVVDVGHPLVEGAGEATDSLVEDGHEQLVLDHAKGGGHETLDLVLGGGASAGEAAVDRTPDGAGGVEL